MNVKMKPVIIASVLCIAMLLVSGHPGSATFNDITLAPHVEVHYNQIFTAGDRLHISIRVDGGMLVRFVFMNGAQFYNWTTNRTYAETLGSWIYNDLSTSQEDRIYEVPANDTYYIVFSNNNAQNITLHYELLVQQPPIIAGMPVLVIFIAIGTVVLISCKNVLKANHRGGMA